ncbi:MAG: ABC transporter permease [Chloroflexota bacterium]
MLRSTLIVARFAVLEVVRKRVIIIGLALTGAYLLLFGLGLHYLGLHIGDLQRHVAGMALFSMGFYLATFLTVLMAAFSGVGAISGEIEAGTAHALLAEPVSRTQVLVGKFLGYAAMLSVYAALFFVGIWGLVAWQLGIALPGLLTVLPLFLLEPLIMLALAFLGSTVMSTLANGVALFLLYGIILVAGMVEQIGGSLRLAGGAAAAATADVMVNIGIVSSLILPLDAIYRRAVFILVGGSLLETPFGSLSVPSPAMLVYAGLYFLACLLLAIRVFKRKSV